MGSAIALPLTGWNLRPLDDAVRIAFTELGHWIHKDYGLSELDAYELLSKVARIRLNIRGPAKCSLYIKACALSHAH